MEKSRCPYCHEYIDSASLAEHIKEHRTLLADGQQRDYVTLPTEERYDKELTGVPVAYVHSGCGVATRMPDEIVRSYMENPYLYLADTTFCAGCNKQVPYATCTWSETGENLQHYFDALRAQKPQYRPAGFVAGGRQAPPSAPVGSAPSSSFSVSRIGIGLAAIIGFGILSKLPRAVLKNADQEVALAPMDGQPEQEAENDQWAEKIRRGEDVPDAILMLAGIKPEAYKLHQVQLRLRKLKQEDKFAELVTAYDAALVDAPDSNYLHNGKAWLLATCKQDEIRNGKVAVEHATKACELTEYNNATYLDTLAAADAEASDFESAIKHVQTAMELTTDEAQKLRFAARLELYKEHKTFRD